MKRSIVLVLCCTLLQTIMSSCSEDGNPAQDTLVGQWRLTSVQVSNATSNQFATEEETIRWVFEINGDYIGNTTVNQFSGRYRLDASNTVTLLEFQTTEVADTQLGNAFYAAITEAIVSDTTFAQLRYTLTGNTLTLTFGDGGRLVLERL